MIKKYFPDILGVVLISTIAILAAGRPAIDLDFRPSMADKGHPFSPPLVKGDTGGFSGEIKKEPKGIIRSAASDEALKGRNIFAADGSYATAGTGMKGPLPENPYTLIGVLRGEEKKAVFRQYTGEIITLTVGKKLIDGSVITRIDNRSVKVKKGKERRELRIFHVENPKQATQEVRGSKFKVPGSKL
jgi:hypothetical protein